MDAFAAATDTLFADPNIAQDAVWRTGGVAAGVTVRVVAKRPDQLVGFGAGRAVRPTALIDVRQSDVTSPTIGDTVTIPGSSPGTSTVYTNIAEPVGDTLGLVWTCEASL